MATVQFDVSLPTRELSKRHIQHADHVECVVYESGEFKVHICPTQIEVVTTEEQTLKVREALDAQLPVHLAPKLEDLEIAQQLRAELEALESKPELAGSTLEDVLHAYRNTTPSSELWTFPSASLAQVPLKPAADDDELQIEIVL